MSNTVTDGVRIQVAPRFHPERSDPDREHWFFSYTVVISNVGEEPVQVLARHWVITDATGKVQHVNGPGVVGETPHLHPGESFRYTSFCPLPTSLGSMHGSYEVRRPDGQVFKAHIDPFVLIDPSTEN